MTAVTSRWHYDVRRSPAAAARVRVVDALGRDVPGVTAAHRQTGGVVVRARVGGACPTMDPDGVAVEHVVFLRGARLVYVDTCSPIGDESGRRGGDRIDVVIGGAYVVLAATAIAALLGAALLWADVWGVVDVWTTGHDAGPGVDTYNSGAR